MWLKIAQNAVILWEFQPVNGISWSPRKIMAKDLRQRSGLAWLCACADICVVFNTGPYTVFPYNYILNTANMQSETGFLSSHKLKSYVDSKSRMKMAARINTWLNCEDIVRQSCAMARKWRVFGDIVHRLFLARCVQNISDLNSNFILRPHLSENKGRNKKTDLRINHRTKI